MIDDRRSAPVASHEASASGSHAAAATATATSGHGGGKGGDGGGGGFVGSLEDAVLRNTNQFHKWHSELEAACASEMEEKYKRYADLLNSHLSSSESILGQVRGRGWSCLG